jgi:hypothetical protein
LLQVLYVRNVAVASDLLLLCYSLIK